jgi:hypothetical protein
MKRRSNGHTISKRKRITERWDDTPLEKDLLFLCSTPIFVPLLEVLLKLFTNKKLLITETTQAHMQELLKWNFVINDTDKIVILPHTSKAQAWQQYISRLLFVFNQRSYLELHKSMPGCTQILQTNEILGKLYQHDLKYCEMNIPNFIPAKTLCSGFVDDYIKCVLLGHAIPRNDGIKYYVMSAYYCSKPVLLLCDRVQFKYFRIEKYCNNSCIVFWDSEVTIEVYQEDIYETESIVTADEETALTNTHLFAERIEKELYTLSQMLISEKLFNAFSEHVKQIIQLEQWIVISAIPKPSQLLPEEQDLLKEFTNRHHDLFIQSSVINHLLATMSFILGHSPHALINYFIEYGLSGLLDDKQLLTNGIVDTITRIHGYQSEIMKYEIKIDDITCGRGVVPIPLINNVDIELLPEFEYLESTTVCDHCFPESINIENSDSLSKIQQDLINSKENKLSALALPIQIIKTMNGWDVQCTGTKDFKSGKCTRFITKNDANHNCIHAVVYPRGSSLDAVQFSSRTIIIGESLMVHIRDKHPPLPKMDIFPEPIVSDDDNQEIVVLITDSEDDLIPSYDHVYVVDNDQFEEDYDDIYSSGDEDDDENDADYTISKKRRNRTAIRKEKRETDIHSTADTYSAEECLNMYVDYLEERRRIEIKREKGEKQPWTKDKVLQSYKFCCIRREDDWGSRVLCDLIKPHCKKGELDPNVLANAIIHRTISRTEFSEELGYIYAINDAFKILNKRIKNNQPIRTSAFTCSVPTKTIKSIWQCAWQKGTKLQKQVVKKGITVNQIAKLLENELEGIGRFLSAQITLDLCMYGVILLDNSWLSFGPGAVTGIRLVMGIQEAEQDKAVELTDKVNQELKKRKVKRTGNDILDDLPPLQLRVVDIEHTLCEYQKYFKLMRGIATSIRKR